MDLIRERTGLLNEQGQDCYAFVHKTFQEYLCAEEIDYQLENEFDFGIILNAIREHLHDAHWREVLLLLIAQQKPKNAAKAIRAVLNNGNEYEEWLHRDLFFAGNCLAEDPKGLRGADGELVQEILEKLVELEIGNDKQVGWVIHQQVQEILCNLHETNFEAQALEMLKEKANLINEWRLWKYQAELGDKNKEIEGLLEKLKNDDYFMRWNAVIALGELGKNSETIVNTLLALLQDENPFVRRSAATALKKLGENSETVLNALLAKFQDDNFDVQKGTAIALGKLGNGLETIVNSLLEMLKDKDSTIRMSAATALAYFDKNSETIVEDLLAKLQDEDSLVRGRAAFALGKLGKNSETVVEALLIKLQDEDSLVRGWAATALGKLGKNSETIVSNLIAMLLDEDYSLCRWITLALGELGNCSETVVSKLITLLLDENYSARDRAAKYLGKFGKKSNNILPTIVQWIQEHQDSEYLGSGIDALWYLVVGEEN
ncbi:MAG: HEAT repeat domain-containing protein [Cyanobacteria bacterium P01_H01_bin.35]